METSAAATTVLTNKQQKVRMSYTILDDVGTRRHLHYQSFSKLKWWSGVMNAVVTALNAVSVCSLVLSLTPTEPVAPLIALSATTTSTIISAVTTAFELDSKVHSHKTSYLQYQDIHRDFSARLFRNGLSSNDLDDMLAEINARLGVVDDGSLPIQVPSDASDASELGTGRPRSPVGALRPVVPRATRRAPAGDH